MKRRVPPSEASADFGRGATERQIVLPPNESPALLRAQGQFAFVVAFAAGEFRLRRRVEWSLNKLTVRAFLARESHPDQLAHAAFFHRYTVEHVGFRDRALVVRDDDELALADETVEH